VSVAETQAILLHYREAGAGASVLLIHGLGQDHTVWNLQIPSLAREFRVIAPDLRGHGQTPAPAGSGFNFEELEGDVRRLLDHLEIEKAHLVGLSAGGFLALRLAVFDASRIKSLTVSGAAGHCDAHTRAVGQSWAEIYRAEGYDAYILRLLKDLYYPDWIENHLDFADRIRESGRQKDLTGVLAWAQAVRSFDLRGRLGRIQIPTLILHGMEDRVVDPSHARYLRQSIPGAKLRLFANTGHMVPIEQPEETERAIASWIRTAEGTQSKEE
jgi:3-oxoadipate enol-lactonase